jgi:hypothetical protein
MQKSPRKLSGESLSELVANASTVVSKSVTEERLTMLSRLRIMSNRIQTIQAIGKPTYSSYVNPAICSKQVRKLLHEQSTGACKRTLARSGANKPSGLKNIRK